jgi:ABC-type dipeptide/oligopeptide/nickel transport system permease subunit
LKAANAALSEAPARTGRRRTTVAALLRHPGAAVGLVVLACLGIVALGAPRIAPRDPLAQDFTKLLTGPAPGHPLGTDHLGRDILSRLVYGARVSLAVGLGAVLLGGSIGTTAGLIGGYFGGWPDRFVIAATDMFLSFPTILLALAFIAILGSGTSNVVLALALAVWPAVARLVRGEVIRVRELQYVEAARALGVADATIVLRHVFPNIMSPLVVVLTFDVGTAILTEAALGFLGLGVPPPLPTWGRVVSEGRDYLRIAPWAITFGGLLISATVLALNLLGDGLRDILDPTLRHSQ